MEEAGAESWTWRGDLEEFRMLGPGGTFSLGRKYLLGY